MVLTTLDHKRVTDQWFEQKYDDEKLDIPASFLDIRFYVFPNDELIVVFE